MLFAEQADNGAAWAVIATLVALLLTFLTTMRRDARKRESEAVVQWKELATAAIAARDQAEKERDLAYERAVQDKVRIAQLEADLRWLRQEGDKL